MSIPTVVVLEGDETGQELLVEALRVLDPDVVGLPLAFEHFDLSLPKRRATKNRIVHEAAAAMNGRDSASKRRRSRPRSRATSGPQTPSCGAKSTAR